MDNGPATVGASCTVAIRPEKVDIQPAATADYIGQPNTLTARIEVLFFIGDRFEARIAVSPDDSIMLYLPSSPQWHEGQDVLLKLPANELQVWPA